MREGEVLEPGPGEEIRCLRSGKDGGPFVFEFTLAPGIKGPPQHSHDEGDETIEVTSGSLGVRVNGEDRILRAGEAVTLSPTDVHTFWNPSNEEPVMCHVTHGARFERAIEQPNFPAMAIYLTFVDPGASRVANPAIRVVLRIIATVARLFGVRPADSAAHESAAPQ